VFDDVETRKDKTLAREALRWNDETQKLIVQSNEKWCGVFFTINSISWDKRRQANVSDINARAVEIDHLSKEDQVKLIELSPLVPSCVVESKRSYHLYWFAENWTKENWRKIMRWVRNFFGWDHKIITEERVMRLPWFDHCKQLEDRYETNWLPMSSRKYTEEQMINAFPDTTNKKEQEKKMKLFMNSDDFWTRAKSINNEHMLVSLSWSKFVNGETIEVKSGQIYVNGHATSSWIDANGKIGSHDNWWPNWTNWLSWYWSVDWKEVYEWTINKFPELARDKMKPNQVITEKEEDVFVEYDRNYKTDYKSIVPFTFGNKKVDEYFGRIDVGRFMTTIWESGSGKTTWAFHQWLIISEKYKVLFISLEMNAERVIDLRAMKMSWITHIERDDKNIPERKKELMEKYKKEITTNKNFEIVWVNRKISRISVDQVIDWIKKKYMWFDWIIIDNLWFIWWIGKDMTSELNYIIRKFKEFCHQNLKNINLLHHFNKWNSKQRKDRDRTFADVMWTAKLEHDIDYAVFISRYLDKREELWSEQKQEVFIKLAKDRDRWQIKTSVIYFRNGRYRDEFEY
jgi:hypothetical protein